MATRTYASIYTMEGNEITVGLQGCDKCDEAIKVAHECAEERGEDVLLLDSDGDWIVHPVGEDGRREPADPYSDPDDEE